MKTIFLTLLLSLSAIGILAQNAVNSSEASDVIVINQEWRFQVRNPALDESPFLEMDERLQEEQELRENAAENRRRARLGLKSVPPPTRAQVQRKDGPISAAYIYEIKVKNTGEKIVRGLTLEYVFFEPNTEREVGRRKFTGKEEIAPGKTKTLVFRSAAPPTGTINAKEGGKKTRYTERVIVQSVEFEDGTAWRVAQKNQ